MHKQLEKAKKHLEIVKKSRQELIEKYKTISSIDLASDSQNPKQKKKKKDEFEDEFEDEDEDEDEENDKLSGSGSDSGSQTSDADVEGTKMIAQNASKDKNNKFKSLKTISNRLKAQ